MERSNQPPKTEGCLAEGIPVDLMYHRKERPSRSVSTEKREPQAGPASGLSNSASKSSSASGDDVLLSESKTNSSAKGKDREGLPGSKSVALTEGNTRNEGDPKSPCRTNYEGQAGREAQRQEVPPGAWGVGLVHNSQPQGASPEAGEGANRSTQSAQATRTVRTTEEDWQTFLRAKRVDLKSPVRENRPPGSVRGAPGNRRPYRDKERNLPPSTVMPFK